MNYYGLVTGGEVEPAEVLAFLKAAMQRIDIDRPYRGPSVHEEIDYKYRDESWGSIQRFMGKRLSGIAVRTSTSCGIRVEC